ncbi:hypothetical protein EVB81_215 [Rhizobium phage RHph_I46]|uniref:Uncharacterized protein n=1 Tax=Rhizobium phage RHph_I1_9 TaxID=2509729 RepID=A0A7S5UWT9_9CAUD|nr:hypothetical protein PP936_gp213 [Rhizobium phage RHph_I1_9]QIG69784.1 hypothetical protein EVB81_215 [Rhizobium phage RHph_I46]QIG71065.1 hypothetical protein EVB92_215 [Rhizobium phage RHph_I9]QIG73650.1 hypothetical protein EVC04_213 [Rhizobium phage RHph_I1_9]QIG76404.1 hypothetical protein EVC25_215 [Rhizobium phage RHph_I34]
MPVQVTKWLDDFGTEFDTYDEAVESNRINKPLEFKDIRVDESIDISDISSEEYRVYEFQETGIIISNPIALHIRNSGAHNVITADGETVYVPAGWLCLRWKVKDGEDHISF